MCKPVEVIHTKGLEKAELLREFHSTVMEIDERINVDDFNLIVSYIMGEMMKKALFVLLNTSLRVYWAGLKPSKSKGRVRDFGLKPVECFYSVEKY